MNTNKPATISTAVLEILDLLEKVVREIILHPEELKIDHDALTRTLTIYIQVHRGDTSKIIGRGGATFRALRAMLEAMGHKAGLAVKLPAIQEPSRGDADSYPPLRQSDQWPRDRVISLMREICRGVFHRVDAMTVEAVDGKGFVTTVELCCAVEETALARAMEPHLLKLFIAIGNVYGRQIEFTVFPTVKSEAQPATAAGRHAGELNR